LAYVIQYVILLYNIIYIVYKSQYNGMQYKKQSRSVRHRQKNEESDVTVIAKPHIMVSICNT